MILHSRFFLFVLLLSFLQPWRLAASTPGAEDFLKYVAAEGECFIDEITGAEGSINHPSPPNAVQPVAQAEEGIISRTTSSSPIVDTHSIADPTSSFSEALETISLVEQSVDFLHGNLIAQVSSAETMYSTILTDKSLGDRILALPPELISISLRSLETKQTSYKAEHQQTAQELQIKYPALAQKITIWKRAVEAWNAISGETYKVAYYQDVVTLAEDMPPELYRLVALSQSMKIMEDAITYTHYLPLAWEKYQSDPKNNVYQAYFFQKLDIINNNIQKLENAADAILSLSEQRNRCLVLAAATAEENANIAELFQAAALDDEKAITAYFQFSQKMKVGEPPIAYFSRIGGFSLECNALGKEYLSQAAIATNRGNAQESYDLQNIANEAQHAIKALNQAVQTKVEGNVEYAKAYEQAAQYRFKAAQALAKGDRWDSAEVTGFSFAASKIGDAIRELNQAAQARNEGKIEDAKVFEQAAQYRFQAAQATASGNNTKGSDLTGAAYNTHQMSSTLKHAAQVRSKGNIEASEVLEHAAQYYFESIQAAINGNSTKSESFGHAAMFANTAGMTFEYAAKARSENNIAQATQDEQRARYLLRSAEVCAQEGLEKASAFSREVYDEELKQRESKK